MKDDLLIRLLNYLDQWFGPWAAATLVILTATASVIILAGVLILSPQERGQRPRSEYNYQTVCIDGVLYLHERATGHTFMSPKFYPSGLVETCPNDNEGETHENPTTEN